VVGVSCVAVVLVGARQGEIPTVPKARGARGGAYFRRDGG
jgi:hypothetical protein